MQILVSGSLAYDRIMSFPGSFADHILPEKIHILNVCFLVDGLDERFGGTAGNIGYSVALLGERPVILATAGKDFEGYESWLTGHDIPLNGIRIVDDEFTAGAYITTDNADNQITGFNPGAMKYACEYNFAHMDPRNVLAIVSPGNLDDMKNLPDVYREKKIPFIIDPGQNIPALSGDEMIAMLEGCKILVTNDYELEMIMKSTGKSRDELLDYCEYIITTLGEHGCVVVDKNGETKVPAAKAAEVKDPTGAGDAFRAGLIKGLVMGKSVVNSAYIGAISSVYCVEQLGTQEHSYTEDQFWARYKENFGEIK
ncbi:carbohydrate kinase family protein [Maridesulfovibrio bastinii]|uniref:carbohydrate kinase family protein n=1 Tax=Maridesulfovibrio bastinii TaxID=47157 RepID=UPI00042196CE|nr:carbohydrate kinase family protein [Maridesulfovibrio bastinii]